MIQGDQMEFGVCSPPPRHRFHCLIPLTNSNIFVFQIPIFSFFFLNQYPSLAKTKKKYTLTTTAKTIFCSLSDSHREGKSQTKLNWTEAERGTEATKGKRRASDTSLPALLRPVKSLLNHKSTVGNCYVFYLVSVAFKDIRAQNTYQCVTQKFQGLKHPTG